MSSITNAGPATYEPGTHPDLAAPPTTVGVKGWLIRNLFSSPANTLLTFVALYLVYVLIPPVIDWALISANWSGGTREECGGVTREGACWGYIGFWMKLLMYGRYPADELWRVNLGGMVLIASLILMLIPRFPYKSWVGAFVLLVYPILCYFLFYGGLGLSIVETPLWGGLFLTLVIAITGIVMSLPLGVVLALGRRSSMPIVKSVCIAFIEFWRGVPLITVLFMSSVMFPLFMPEGVNFDKLLRALVGVMLFSSAYMAEVVRGGLQAIPKGQYEAAQALGLSFWRVMGLIVLPQALKIVIPGIVNTFIGLFKDTTLVLIIGLLDFLGSAQAASTNPAWLGFSIEGYVFVAFVFWVFCFSMSRYSQHLEDKLHTGHRR
ncbi:MAG: amino acid ABC transporter permease [Gammaproteobacteria bacterium]